MAASTTVVLSQIKSECLKRGVAGVKELGKTLGAYDDERRGKVSFEEFESGLLRYGCDFTTDELLPVFNKYDHTGNGFIDIEEFFREIRPNMSPYRYNLARRVFEKIDVDSSGAITLSDIRKIFDVEKHPKYKSGEMTARDVFQGFLNEFDANQDDVVTLDEWLDYYAGVSATIDRDVYFDFMMRQHWKM